MIVRGTVMEAKGKVVAKHVRSRSVKPESNCAVCACQLDASPIKVRSQGKTVEVCSNECAVKFEEGHASAGAAKRG